MGKGGRAGKGREQTWHLGSILVSSGLAQQSNKCWHFQRGKIVFCVSGGQVGGNERLKKKKKVLGILAWDLKELKEAIQVAEDVDLEELPSVCELLPGYKPAEENQIKINIE